MGQFFVHMVDDKTHILCLNSVKVRRSATHQFGYLIPRDYQYALELDKLNGNSSRWYDTTKMEMDQISEYQVFKDYAKAKYNPKSKWITMPLKVTRRSMCA